MTIARATLVLSLLLAAPASAAGFGEPERLAQVSRSAAAVIDAATAPDGTVTVLYESGARVRALTRAPGARPQDLGSSRLTRSEGGVFYGEGALAVGRDGSRLAVWPDQFRLLAALAPAGGRFSRAQVVGSYHYSGQIQATVGGDGSAMIAWVDGAVHAAVRRPGARWTEPQQIGSTDDRIALSADGRGGAFVVAGDRIATLEPGQSAFGPAQEISPVGRFVARLPDGSALFAANGALTTRRADGTWSAAEPSLFSVGRAAVSGDGGVALLGEDEHFVTQVVDREPGASFGPPAVVPIRPKCVASLEHDVQVGRWQGGAAAISCEAGDGFDVDTPFTYFSFRPSATAPFERLRLLTGDVHTVAAFGARPGQATLFTTSAGWLYALDRPGRPDHRAPRVGTLPAFGFHRKGGTVQLPLAPAERATLEIGDISASVDGRRRAADLLDWDWTPSRPWTDSLALPAFAVFTVTAQVPAAAGCHPTVRMKVTARDAAGHVAHRTLRWRLACH